MVQLSSILLKGGHFVFGDFCLRMFEKRTKIRMMFQMNLMFKVVEIKKNCLDLRKCKCEFVGCHEFMSYMFLMI